MKRVKILIIIGLAVLIGAAVIVLVDKQPLPIQEQSSEQASPTITNESFPESIPSPESAPEPEKPAQPPEEKIFPLPLTEPDIILPLSSESEAKLRSFKIKMSQSGFEPATIVVNQGDRVEFKITAIDSNYDISIPRFEYQNEIPLGKTNVFSFDARESGRFVFSCRDKCPEGKVIQGELVVLSK